MDPYGDEAILLRPVRETGRWFWAVVLVLASIGGWGIYTWTWQLRNGLGVTGLNVPVYWGIYITNFVFFIGISHAGTLISAILRLCHAEWRRPITRAAEVITVMVLYFGVGNILLDLGRPDRALNVVKHPNFTSPLLWDVMSITTYLIGSTTYLYLPLIPDIATMRDALPRSPRQWCYRAMALGWTGSQRQWRWLNRGIAIMAVVIIPIAVSVHTVVSWVFGMTTQAMWHSTIFGPYFVVGAIFSGIAALLITMAIVRRVYHLEAYLKPVHFNNLGLLLLVMTLLWLYFTFSEYVTTFYGGEPSHMAVFYAKISGRYAPLFWTMVATCFVIPFAILCNRYTRTIRGIVVASVSICIGMWLERFTIVVPTLARSRTLGDVGNYTPSWVEWSMTAAFFALFALVYIAFTKWFPIIAMWEIREGRERAVEEVSERVESYLPAPVGG